MRASFIARKPCSVGTKRQEEGGVHQLLVDHGANISVYMTFPGSWRVNAARVRSAVRRTISVPWPLSARPCHHAVALVLAGAEKGAAATLPPMTQMVGLIAGAGELPIIVARGMRAAGREICAVGLRDQYHADLPALCDHFRTAGVARPGSWIRTLRKHGVREAIMVGRVEKRRMHDPLRLIKLIPDLRAISIWYRRLRHDRRNAALLAAVADELARSGVSLIDSTTFIRDHLVGAGPNGARRATPEIERDIAFGWPILQQIAALDVGQSIAVRERDIVAVEAVEGTDAMIERAGRLCPRGGWTLLKTAPDTQDLRADVPTIGHETIRRLAEAGGRAIALGTGRVIIVNKPEVITEADRLGIAVIGVESVSAGLAGTANPEE